MKTIKLTFVTDAGKSFPVSMNYADPELTGTEGVAKVQAAVAAVIAQQPYEATIASCEKAELIERTSTEIALA